MRYIFYCNQLIESEVTSLSQMHSFRLSPPDEHRFQKALTLTHESKSEFIHRALDNRIDTILRVKVNQTEKRG